MPDFGKSALWWGEQISLRLHNTICLPTHPYWLATNPLHKIKTYIMEGEIMRTTSTPGKQAGFWHRLKNSTMQTPWHILRQLALLAPLGTLCLPMFYAGHKNVSLITACPTTVRTCDP